VKLKNPKGIEYKTAFVIYMDIDLYEYKNDNWLDSIFFKIN